MRYWITFYCLLVLVCAQPSDNKESCLENNCVGEEYKCVKGQCFCADGYIPNYFMIRCVRCPGLGEKCHGPCCSYGNATVLHCWQGICQPCYDHVGNGICRDSLDQLLLISTTQIVMGAALILGIIATFILIYKLCAVTSLRPLGRSNDSRLSIGSLQLYVEERLRDAPPRYSRAPAAGSAIYPITHYINPEFIHDYSIPPPPYTPERKNEDPQNPALHI